MTPIDYSHSQYVATIAFLRDDKRNAINQRMAEAILDAFNRAEEEGARVVVLRARPGAEVWCAGHDLSELDPGELLSENPTIQIAERIRSLPLPVICLVEGGTYGGGLILLLYADIVIAAQNAQVAITSNKLGIPLDPEILAYWLRVIGLHKTKELLFTAEPIKAQDALQAGLYNHLVDADQLDVAVETYAKKICGCSKESIAETKQMLNRIASETALSAQDLGAFRSRNTEIFQSAETQERIKALLDAIQEST